MRENNTIQYGKCVKEQKRLMQRGHESLESVGSMAHHFVNCSYHIFPGCFFANCAAWRQSNPYKSRTCTVNDIAVILGIGRASAYKLANLNCP